MGVIVIGATGFIGRNLLTRLAQDNQKIKCLVRNRADLADFSAGKLTLLEGDLTRAETLNKIVEDGDIVYYLAGAVGKHSEKDYYEINLGGLDNFLKFCRGKVKKFIYLSSGSVAGGATGTINERTECRPLTDYGKTKLLAEKRLLELYQREGFSAVILRAPIVYGPRDLNQTRDLSILKLIKYVLAGKFFLVGSGEGSFRSILYVGNLTEAMVMAAREEKTSGQIYFITDAETKSLKALAEIIARVGGAPFKEKHWPKPMAYALAFLNEKRAKIKGGFPQFNRRVVKAMTADWLCYSEKAEKDFGYKPRYSAEEAIKITLAWYKINKII